MKSLFLVVGIVIITCCTARKTINSISNTDTLVTAGAGNNVQETDIGLPGCIKKLIVQFQQEEKQSPPRRIYRYTYKGNIVFYVPAVCCDFFSDLYDIKCNLVAHPDGGFTGRGDGTAPDFLQTRTGEKLIWKDERK